MGCRAAVHLSHVAHKSLTNHAPSFSETLDYLVLCGRGLAVRRVLTLPLRSEPGGGVPDGDRPSDHLPLVADVVLTD
jgi:hypothetical protein